MSAVVAYSRLSAIFIQCFCLLFVTKSGLISCVKDKWKMVGQTKGRKNAAMRNGNEVE